MLPILPAILLLLLRGPSNIERLAREGRLPAGLEAVRREMAQPTPASRAKTDAALAAMLTSRDPRIAQALIGLLQTEEPEPAKTPVPAPEARTQPAPPDSCALTDGLVECRRSRDGPRVIA